jgi:DNA-binding response OmpR family regulator
VRCAPKGDPLLRQVRVFIAEDEPFIALNLASEVQGARGHVIGPAGSVAEALSLLEHTQPHVGLLDANLSDGEITPVAELLRARAVPILFYCGQLPAHLRYPDVPVYIKPMPPYELVIEIAALLRRVGNRPTSTSAILSHNCGA